MAAVVFRHLPAISAAARQHVLFAGQREAAMSLAANLSHDGGWGNNGSGRSMTTIAVKGVTGVHAGTGGRSSVSGIVATVFGATGFLGRYVVNELARRGSQIVVPYRGDEDHVRPLKLAGDLGQIVPLRFNLSDQDSIRDVIAGSNVVINLIGRSTETYYTSFEDANVKAAAVIAALCKENGGVDRLIHFSCLGASETAPSRYLRSKAEGDAWVREVFPRATILKPAPVYGPEDRFLIPIAKMCREWMSVPIIDGGQQKVAPVHVNDVASAVTGVLRSTETIGQEYQLAGPDVLTYKEVVDLVFDEVREYRNYTQLPSALAKLAATPHQILTKVFPLPLPQNPHMSKDFIDGLAADLVQAPGSHGFDELGILPRKMEGINIQFLRAFRKGGPFMGTTYIDENL
eukprot:jgi/Mesvir1/919/Mv17479-RA.1